MAAWGERARAGLPALWLGLLLAVAALAAPSAFAVLPAADAGRLVARLFTLEARCSLALGVAIVLLQRRRARSVDATLWLSLGALFCTVAGFYALQPLMAAARAGEGRWSFGQLHAASLACYGLKTLLVGALAWRALGAARPGSGTPAAPVSEPGRPS